MTTTTPMPFRRAAAIAVEALKAQRGRYAFDAKMHAGGIETVATERAAKRYRELSEAIETLAELGKVRVE